MIKLGKSFSVLVLCFSFCSFAFAGDTGEKNISQAAFVQGAKSFQRGEWMSAVFTLRRAVSYAENYNADTWYMLITAEMYAGEYKSSYQDCELFLKNFSSSLYTPFILYHRGRALFCLGEYERSILLLSDFCHQYPDHEMYASSLFWIAESFFTGYNYNEAKSLYTRIVNEFPDDAKAVSAQFRIETINQSEREEKLLYLLKETGEEYLIAKEEYERQLKMSGGDEANNARRLIMDLQHKNAELERKVAALEQSTSDLEDRLGQEQKRNQDIKNDTDDILSRLKQKALMTQELLDNKVKQGE